MKKSKLQEELVEILQNVTGTKSESLMSLYFSLNPTKFDKGILALMKFIAFDEEAIRENIPADDATYKKLIDYFKNFTKVAP